MSQKNTWTKGETMTKNDHYEISDSLWGRMTQFGSAVWESWGKDVDEYVEDVMDTDRRSDDELYASTVLQDSFYNVELVSHLVGSVFSNDYTKERLQELGSAIANTESYQSTAEVMHSVESQINQATEQFMKEHPKVQTAFMATEEKLEEVKAYVTKEAKTFLNNHQEFSHNLEATIDLATLMPAAKAVKVASEARELSKLNKLDYEQAQGNELAKGIPSEVDKKSLNLEELAVTAEAKVGTETLFDVNQKARAVPHPQTPTLTHDEIRAKEAKNIAKVERKIERNEKEGNPLTETEIENEFRKASKPNATLAQSHAETAVIQKAYEQGLTKDADMFIKVNGQEVCGHCNSDTIAMAKESGLKSITIHNYKIDNTKRIAENKEPLGPIIHWNHETGKDRYKNFEELEKTFPNLPKAPDHIKHAGVIEAERESMNKMDMVLLGVGGTVLMQEDVNSSQYTSQLDTVAQNSPKTSFDPDSIDYSKYLPQSVRSSYVNSSDLSQDCYESEIPNLRSAYDNGLPDSINTLFEERGWGAPEEGYAHGHDDAMVME